MGTPTPRKFSEKIALMERKQNEDQELFHSIMRDVKAITSNNSTSNPSTPLPCTQSTNHPSNNFIFHQNVIPGFSNTMVNNIYQQSSTTLQTTSTTSCTPYQEIPITSNTLQLQNNGWNGCGGSLPNVHDPYFNQNQTVPQNTLNAFYSNNNNYNNHPLQMGPSSSSTHMRSRSPGAPNHYHPYSGGGGLSVIRSRPHCERQNTFDGYDTNYPGTSNQLVPPDMYPYKARSDSAINVYPHGNYHNGLTHNNHYNQEGILQNYEQFHTTYNQNDMINNGNLIEDISPNNIPSYNNYPPSTNSSRQESPISQQPITQSSTNFCTNYQYDNQSTTSPTHSPQYPPTSTYSAVSSPVCYTPSLGSPNSISQDSPINNTVYPSSSKNIIHQQSQEYPCQQSPSSYVNNGILNNQQQSPIQVIGLPNTNPSSPQQQQSSCQQQQIMINQNGTSNQSCQQQQQQSSPIVTYPQSQPSTYPQQNYIGPYSTMSQDSFQKQSSPESPSTSTTGPYDNSSSSPRGYPPGPKKYSNSPDPLDIPNIVLIGADGELDCFQNLNLTNEHYDYQQQVLTNNGMMSCGNGMMMPSSGQQEMLVTTGTEISSSYHGSGNPSMKDLHSSIIIKKDFIN
uniref:TORC_N domain-containing protein n=1 Tax=Strongyloides venezuelensis TaxID=75913 RepID=A0A0K0FGR9_STRVS